MAFLRAGAVFSNSIFALSEKQNAFEQRAAEVLNCCEKQAKITVQSCFRRRRRNAESECQVLLRTKRILSESATQGCPKRLSAKEIEEILIELKADYRKDC